MQNPNQMQGMNQTFRGRPGFMPQQQQQFGGFQERPQQGFQQRPQLGFQQRSQQGFQQGPQQGFQESPRFEQQGPGPNFSPQFPGLRGRGFHQRPQIPQLNAQNNQQGCINDFDQRIKMSKAKVFQTNDRIFAKVKGYPAWPACVIDPKFPSDLKGSQYKVCFYGTYEEHIVSKKYMWLYNESTKAKFGNQKHKGFLEAINEIENRPEVGYLTNEYKHEEPISALMHWHHCSDDFKPRIELKKEDSIAFERGIEETLNLKIEPDQLKIKEEVFFDLKSEVKKEGTKFHPMLIKSESEPIGDDFKPKLEIKEEDIVFKRGIEVAMNLKIDGNTVPNTLNAFDTNRK